MTSAIRVYAGTETRRGELIGEVKVPPDSTGWIEVPNGKRRSSAHFWIELDKSSLLFVMIDEVSFK